MYYLWQIQSSCASGLFGTMDYDKHMAQKLMDSTPQRHTAVEEPK